MTGKYGAKRGGRAAKPRFMPGLKLSSEFFADIVKPLLDGHYPGLRCSAALIGSGSEVMGFDTEMSRDHNWGPRVMLFLTDTDYDSLREEISLFFRNNLPPSYRGYSTGFSPPDPDDRGTQVPAPIGEGPVNHRIETFTIPGFFLGYMGININGELASTDWLSLPFQKLRAVTGGGVFHDDLGLEEARNRLAWYPRDVWLYLLASAWARIGQEEHLTGRAGIVGDQIGSAISASRLVRDIMNLAFLMEKQYPPYPKWFGSGFAGLSAASVLTPILLGVIRSRSWKSREPYLMEALSRLAEMHNSLGLTRELPQGPSQFWARPFKVVWGEKIAETIIEAIQEPRFAAMARKTHVGSVDLFSDNTDFLSDASLRPRIKGLYSMEQAQETHGGAS